MLFATITFLMLLGVLAFGLGRIRAQALAAGGGLHSRPLYHGQFLAACAVLPGLIVLVTWLAAEPRLLQPSILRAAAHEGFTVSSEEQARFVADVRALARGDTTSQAPTPVLAGTAERYRASARWAEWMAGGLAGVLSLAGLAAARRRLAREFPARAWIERGIRWLLAACAALAVAVTLGIVASLIFESLRFFSLVSPTEFLFGTQWSPQTALRADQVGSSGAFGAIPVFAGTLLITAIALAVAAPAGLLSAIYLSEYARAGVRAWVKPLLEILAGVPTVVYGFFAALSIAPLIRSLGARLGLDVASESALAAGLVMGVMIIPFISSLSDDVINAVPSSLREGSLGLGATPSETIRRVVLPAALPGIVASLLLAVSRAIGETMIVVMAAGLAANLTVNPLDAVTTVTVQIVTLLVGDQEFDSAKTLAAFALGLMLFAVTLGLNVVALTVVRRYREQYE